METARFWIDVSEPGGLAPGGAGRATAMRVRIMHVFLRRRLLAHPAWVLDAWGMPISQSDALITLMSSSLTPGLAMHLMGYRTSLREIDAMLHCSRYITHLPLLRRREAWWRNEMGEKQPHFNPAEELRR